MILPNVSSTSTEIKHFSEDTIPPAPVINLQAVGGLNPETIDLSWIAPGGDGTTGTATAYIVRYNNEPITEGNWNNSFDVSGEPLPQSSGSVESMTITGLIPGSFIYVALKTQDEIPNTSSVSNVVWVVTTRLPNPIFLPLIVNSQTEVPVIIPDTTKVLSESTTQYLAEISVDGSTYTFTQSTPELLSLEPGDIMVSNVAEDAPHGFLRQVTSISMIGDQVIIVSDQAALDQAIESGKVKLRQTITPNEIRESSLPPGVETNVSADKFEFYVHDLVLYDGDGNPFTEEDQIRADGTLGFVLSYDFTLLIQNFELKECSFTNSVVASDNLEIKTKIDLASAELEFEFARIYLSPITVMVGYLPVVIEPVITINIGLNGEVSVGVETSVTQVVTLKTGVEYKNGAWGPISEFSNEFQIDPPHLSAGLHFKGYFGPRLSLLIYGLVGPYADVDIFAELEADIFDDPWWSLYGGLEVPIGVRVEVLSHLIAHYETVAIGFRMLLAQAESNNPPNAPSNPIPLNGAQDQSRNVDLFWNGGDPDGENVTYSVYLEANDPTPDILVSEGFTETNYDPGTLLANTQYYWRVVATDEHGATNAGLIWKFTTGNSTNHPPNIPFDPYPLNGSSGEDINIDLSWSGGDPDGDFVTYDVYFEANDNTPDVLVSANQSSIFYDPGTLAYSTHYYWQIIARDEQGTTTTGLIWDFITAQLAEITERVSISSSGDQGNALSWGPSISADERFVAFNSDASTLVDGDTNGYQDVFVHDRQTNATTRASVSTAGEQGDAGSQDPSISADGRYLAFFSYASNLVEGDTNGLQDVFVNDQQTGATTRVSVSSDGEQANSASGYPSISADGRYVAFASVASNLVEGDTNNQQDIFVHDRQTGETTRVSINSAGEQGNNWSDHPSITADGQHVTFTSPASNLVDGDTNGYWDVFVHGRQTGSTTRDSVSSSGEQGNNNCEYQRPPSISADGRYVSFRSYASNLVDGDTNGYWDVFVHDRQTGSTTRDSVSSIGEQGNDNSFDPSISADGRYVVFMSLASNLVEEDTNDNGDIFVRDRQTGATTRVSVNSDVEQANNGSWDASISADGSDVAFASYASNLVAGDTNVVPDIFVHHRVGNR